MEFEFVSAGYGAAIVHRSGLENIPRGSVDHYLAMPFRFDWHLASALTPETAIPTSALGPGEYHNRGQANVVPAWIGIALQWAQGVRRDTERGNTRVTGQGARRNVAALPPAAAPGAPCLISFRPTCLPGRKPHPFYAAHPRLSEAMSPRVRSAMSLSGMASAGPVVCSRKAI